MHPEISPHPLMGFHLFAFLCRFSIFRDGQPLDPEHFGLQSVRAMQKGLKSVAVMTFMDDPQEGPHVYEVRSSGAW